MSSGAKSDTIDMPATRDLSSAVSERRGWRLYQTIRSCCAGCAGGCGWRSGSGEPAGEWPGAGRLEPRLLARPAGDHRSDDVEAPPIALPCQVHPLEIEHPCLDPEHRRPDPDPRGKSDAPPSRLPLAPWTRARRSGSSRKALSPEAKNCGPGAAPPVSPWHGRRYPWFLLLSRVAPCQTLPEAPPARSNSSAPPEVPRTRGKTRPSSGRLLDEIREKVPGVPLAVAQRFSASFSRMRIARPK